MTAQPRASSFLLLGVFLVAAIGIGAIGYRSYVERKGEAEHDIRLLMATAGDLKVRQVAAWRAERRGDAEMVARQAGPMPVVQAVLIHDGAYVPANAEYAQRGGMLAALIMAADTAHAQQFETKDGVILFEEKP